MALHANHIRAGSLTHENQSSIRVRETTHPTPPNPTLGPPRTPGRRYEGGNTGKATNPRQGEQHVLLKTSKVTPKNCPRHGGGGRITLSFNKCPAKKLQILLRCTPSTSKQLKYDCVLLRVLHQYFTTSARRRGRETEGKGGEAVEEE